MEQVQKPRERLDAPRPNRTGIPGRMKRDFEGRSGLSFDDVRVHYNSDSPARLGALAYTRGTQVYLGPGQERYLPHELGHVVQQMTRPVPATRRGGGVPVNDDPALEAEAERWSAGAAPVDGAVQLFRGQDVAQCAGGGPKTWLDHIYNFAAKRLPDVGPWKTLPQDKSLMREVQEREVTLGKLIGRVQEFQREPSLDTWTKLKGVLIDTLNIDAAAFERLFPGHGVLFTILITLRQLSAQTDQTVESLVVDQVEPGSYRDLPRYIHAAKKMVSDAVSAMGDVNRPRYLAYFAPQAYWKEGAEITPEAEEPRDDTILPPSKPFHPVLSSGMARGRLFQPSTLSSNRQLLLQRFWQEKSEMAPQDWFDLQTKRGGGVSEEERAQEKRARELASTFLRTDKPDIQVEKSVSDDQIVRESQELEMGKRAQPIVMYRYNRILEGLDWLTQDPYLKILIRPQELDTYGMTMRGGGQHSAIDLMGAYQKSVKETGMDSRPGVLIHEISHSFAKTDDFGYGDDIKKLFVKQAVKNADTYEYAAEDAYSVQGSAPAPAPVFKPHMLETIFEED